MSEQQGKKTRRPRRTAAQMMVSRIARLSVDDLHNVFTEIGSGKPRIAKYIHGVLSESIEWKFPPDTKPAQGTFDDLGGTVEDLPQEIEEQRNPM